MGDSERITDLEGQLISLGAKVCELEELLSSVTGILKNTLERLKATEQDLYEIAPEVEIINAMADDEAERAAMIEQYMNHGQYS